jgi:geranylgeranyl transferase type-2 subunit beta
MLDALDDQSRDGAIVFLGRMQTAEGGLRANTQIPAADLLSTFTGLQTLDALDAREAVDRQAARQYVLWLRRSEGGFSAGIWDDATDVEYAFYGLGSLALLSADA